MDDRQAHTESVREGEREVAWRGSDQTHKHTTHGTHGAPPPSTLTPNTPDTRSATAAFGFHLDDTHKTPWRPPRPPVLPWPRSSTAPAVMLWVRVRVRVGCEGEIVRCVCGMVSRQSPFSS